MKDSYLIAYAPRLEGTVRPSAAKNAVLPILFGCLLVSGEVTLHNVPRLPDVTCALRILETLGVSCSWQGESLLVDARFARPACPPPGECGRMRASILAAGPLLSRFGSFTLQHPGGCQIGARPVDYHVSGLKRLGGRIKQENGLLRGFAGRLRGAGISLDYPSVGATENLIMAAVLAKGTTLLQNAAAEPEIADLAKFLNRMGADIRGAGSDTVAITGVSRLHGGEYKPMPDRIEAGTFLCAAALCGGDVTVRGMVPAHSASLLYKLSETGALLTVGKAGVRLQMPDRPKAVSAQSLPYPGYPTDLLPPFSALLCRARGTGVIKETVFEARFTHLGELERLGAKIRQYGNTAIISGRDRLTGAEVTARDLRGGAALLLGCLAARGQSELHDSGCIARGYANLCGKFAGLGAAIAYRQEAGDAE